MYSGFFGRRVDVALLIIVSFIALVRSAPRPFISTISQDGKHQYMISGTA